MPDSDDHLINLIRKQAQQPSSRRGSDSSGPLPAPASLDDCAAAESLLGTTIYPFHRRLLTEVANGGFGPAYGLFGLPADAPRLRAEEGSAEAIKDPSMMALRDYLLPNGSERSVPPLPESIWRGLLPICDWGCAMWSFIDSSSQNGAILHLGEGGLLETTYDIRSFFADWARGVRLQAAFRTARPARTGINPFTRQQVTFKALERGEALGGPYTGQSPRRS